MFWKPHGKPINYLTVENGQWAEGYVKPLFHRKYKVKDGRIKLIAYDTSIRVYLAVPRESDQLIGYIENHHTEFRPMSNAKFRLYDGDLARRAKKSRAPQVGIIGRLWEVWR